METFFREGKSIYDVAFKSYYVVWKPVLAGDDVWRQSSLNRTM